MSLFILGLMLLGLDAMAIHALQETRKNYFLTLAESRLFDLGERIRAGGDQMEEQVSLWEKENANLMIPIASEITSGTSSYHIKISWPIKNELSEEINL